MNSREIIISKKFLLLILNSLLLTPSISIVPSHHLPRQTSDNISAPQIANDTGGITNTTGGEDGTKAPQITNDTGGITDDTGGITEETGGEQFDFCTVSCPGGPMKICESMWSCKPINGCTPISIGHDFRKHVIASHNNHRNEVALGKTSLPKAADISLMNYEMHLEYISECYASNCKVGYDDCNKTSFEGPIGLNYYKVHTNEIDLKAASSVSSVVEQWFGENVKIKADAVSNFSTTNGNNFTQMIWASTIKVGCALSSDSAGFGYMICSYYPPGNIEGENMYTAGDPCSACPVCNRRYKGLCGYGKDQPEVKGCFPIRRNNYILSVTGLFLVFLIML